MRYAVNRLEGAILKGMEHALAVDLETSFAFPTAMNSPDPFMNGFDFDPFDDLTNLGLEAFDWLSATNPAAISIENLQ